MTVANPTGAARDSGVRLKLPKQQRAMGIEPPTFDAESRTITFPFSSETPVDRWFGAEVLSHRADAVDLSRLNDGAPLLYNHDPGQLIGVIERAWLQDGRGYATARFSQNDLAQQVMQDVQDGILRNVSVGYRILEMNPDGEGSDSVTYTATRWMPYELSAVSIGADNSVGFGRSEDGDNETEVSMPDASAQEAAVSKIQPIIREKTMSEFDRDSERKEAAAAERSRISSINAWGEKFKQADLARQLIESGRSIEEAQGAFLEKLGAKQEPIDQGTGNVELTTKEQRDYSLVRAINASISGNWSEAGFEREVSAEIERQTGRATSGFFMPHNLEMRAPYAVGAAGTGGNLVATNLLAGSFIDVLRNSSLIMEMNPTLLTGLVGNVALPRQSTATNTYWVTEAGAITEAEATFDQVTLSPKQIGARSQYSRLALQQTTPDIETVVRNDLAKVLALGIDLAAISGSGSSGQPTGILNTAGIGSVAMGTNGAAFTDSASGSTSGLDQLIQLERAVDVANALNGSLYYLTNAKVVSKLKTLKTAYGEYLWSSADGVTINGTPGGINGYPVMRSNQVPSNLTKGSGSSLSALIFGNFADLVIGMWGATEILVNPYGAGYNAGSIDIRAMQTVDVAIKHAASFAAISDIIA